MAMEKLILFQVNEQVLGMDVEYVRAIEAVTDFVCVPNAPANIEGIINLRGEVIPVYSLHKKFNFPMKTLGEESQLIIARGENATFALIVDGVNEIHVMQEGEFVESPQVLQSSETTYMQGIATVNNTLVLCIDINQLVSELEMERVQSFLERVTKSES